MIIENNVTEGKQGHSEEKKNEWVTDYIMQEGQGTFELESIYCILEIGDTL